MPERATISQVVQLGVETTPGTGVPANRKLKSLLIDGGVRTAVQTFRGSGYKYASVAAQGKEWSEWGLSGPVTYDELIYPLVSILGGPTSNAQIATTGAYRWIFDPSSVNPDTVKTFTLEQGDSVRAHKAAYFLVNELGVSVNRDEANVSGRAIARAIADAITMTGSPTELEGVPAVPGSWSAYLDATSGGLGGTKLTRALELEWSLGSRFNPLWVVDSAQSSFVNHVETEPEAQIRVLVEADAAGMGILPTLRAGTTSFVRFQSIGPVISGAGIYEVTFDQAVKWTEVEDFSDEDGVFAIRYTGTITHDATWGKALHAEVVNKRSAL